MQLYNKTMDKMSIILYLDNFKLRIDWLRMLFNDIKVYTIKLWKILRVILNEVGYFTILQ